MNFILRLFWATILLSFLLLFNFNAFATHLVGGEVVYSCLGGNQYEIKVIIYNHGNEDFVINNKDRIAQMILTPVIKMELQEVEELPETIRGKGGFGSTGK